MLERLNPPTVPAPASTYSQVVIHPANARRIVVSGQVGVRADGTVVEGLDAQVEQAFRNLIACLAAAGAGPEHIVKVTSFMVAPGDVMVARKWRQRLMPGVAPASTYLVVAGLASSSFLFEVECEAIVP
jgi:enamine deaminase RidA (YjgF/YER057c/UK114 family)